MNRSFNKQQRRQPTPAYIETNPSPREEISPLLVICQEFGCKRQATSWFHGPKCEQHGSEED